MSTVSLNLVHALALTIPTASYILCGTPASGPRVGLGFRFAFCEVGEGDAEGEEEEEEEGEDNAEAEGAVERNRDDPRMANRGELLELVSLVVCLQNLESILSLAVLIFGGKTVTGSK